MNRDEAVELLGRDPLRHIVTLKMLALYGEHMDLRFVAESGEWALLSLLPTDLSDYDSRAYATTRRVVLVDGNSATLKLRLLDDLPRCDMVVKTYDPAVKRHVMQQFAGEPVASFTSFSAPPGLTLSACDGTEESSTLSEEAAASFGQAGYSMPELEKWFREGARWFGIRKGGTVVSGCFVYRNFDSVWEIAGVFTEPNHRRQRLAATVVTAALVYLLELQRRPRYQVPITNTASTQLARGIGLQEFLSVDHLLVKRGGAA